MNSNIIKKQIQLNNRAAASLFKKYEAINELGTGILSSIKNINNQQSVSSACTLLTFEQITNIEQGQQKHLIRSRAIYIKIQSFQQVSIETIKKILLQIRALKLYNSISHLLSGFLLEWNQQFDQSQYIETIRYLQYQNFVVLIEPHVSLGNWKDYQLSLSNFAHFVLQNQNIFLASISLILSFPPFESLNYSKILLSVWKRVLPSGIGRIALKDDNLQDYPSHISDLFHVKGLLLNWKIQFLTSKTNNWEQLQQKVLGIE